MEKKNPKSGNLFCSFYISEVKKKFMMKFEFLLTFFYTPLFYDSNGT